MKNFLLLLKGFLIGVANVIPGVSGGTFALLLGVFHRLMDALGSITPRTFRLFFLFPFRFLSPSYREELKQEWQRIQGNFLLLLGIGALLSILTSSWLISYLLKHHPRETLAFFLGLILPSLYIPYKMIQKKHPFHLFHLLFGITLPVGISLFLTRTTATSPHPLWVFLCGALAISAMILPGLSGSFVLLLLGQYQNVIEAIKKLQRHPTDLANLLFLTSFALGCLVGLLLFARLLKYLLHRFPSATLFFLIGLILGSFWTLYPFKEYQKGVKGSKKSIQIATAPNRLPKTEEIPLAALTFSLGLLGGIGLNRWEKGESHGGF